MSDKTRIDRIVAREVKTIRNMMKIYCKAHHDSGRGLCDECERLLEYTESRIGKCPQLENKPACRECTIHCFSPDSKKRMLQVMRFAGPRMMYRHPILALLHLMKK